MAFSSLFSEDQFQCSICLDVFTDPVSTPCGHNFCKTCITGYWDSNDRCQCPMCKNDFERPPDLKVNTFISEMIAQFKKLACVKDKPGPLEQSPLAVVESVPESVAESVAVPCDLCTEIKVEALKSCLVCLASYCETHLKSHRILASFKKHKLIDPVENLENLVCEKHERPLEMFCKDDRVCVCLLCVATGHKTHTTVLVDEACDEMRAELARTEARVQQAIQGRRREVREIGNSVKVSERNTKNEITDAVRVFTSVIRCAEKRQAEIIAEAEKRQKDVERRAEETVEALEREIEALQVRGSELKALSHAEDQLHLLKRSPSLCTLPPAKTFPEVKALVDRSTETVLQAVSDMKETLGKELDAVHFEKIKHYAVDLTLNPRTAHQDLVLSADGKEVRYRKQINITRQLYGIDTRESYTGNNHVLAKEGFVSGKFYYEVEMTNNISCVVGVAEEPVAEDITCNPDRGVWSVQVSRGVCTPKDKGFCLSAPQRTRRLGVFVDYEKRGISFCNAETGASIYSFSQCGFSGKLYPFFSNNSANSAPLILRPVPRPVVKMEEEEMVID